LAKTVDMKLLIVPTDFSPVADNALKYAMDMALAMNMNIMLVNVYQLPISYSEVPLVTISLDELRKISESKLAELKGNILRISEEKIKVYTESRLGDVSEEVKSLARTLQPFGIVMGTRGVSGAGRFFLGSNSLSVIEKVGVPVFIIPPGARFKPIKRIGLASDLRDVVDNTPVSTIREMVNFFNADLHVMNVDFERRHFTPYTPEESLKLETLLMGLNPIYDFIEKKDVDEGIIEFAERKEFDLVVTFPKKHSFFEKIFESSTTRELIHHTHIPLMCVHPVKEMVKA
jgi:nucleotide-binding universal stress UspA family protein